MAEPYIELNRREGTGTWASQGREVVVGYEELGEKVPSK